MNTLMHGATPATEPRRLDITRDPANYMDRSSDQVWQLPPMYALRVLGNIVAEQMAGGAMQLVRVREWKKEWGIDTVFWHKQLSLYVRGDYNELLVKNERTLKSFHNRVHACYYVKGVGGHHLSEMHPLNSTRGINTLAYLADNWKAGLTIEQLEKAGAYI